MTFRQPDFHAGAWERKSIEEVCTSVTSGGTPSRKNMDFYSGGTIPWIKTKELNDGLLFESEEKITEVALSSSSAKMLPKNTILLAMIGATVGKLGILGRPASCNQNSAALIVDDKVADYRFLFYTLLANREKLIGLAAGGAQAILSGRNIKQIEFLFPDLRTQAVIGATLAVLDEKIQINNRLSKTLEDIAQTIFKSWFIDFDPVTAKMAGEQPVGMDAVTAALFPDSMEDSELGLIPKGWKIETIGNLTDTLLGGTPSRNNANFWNGDIPWIKSGKINDFRVLTPTEFITNAGLAKSATKLLPKGTTVLAITGATLGQFSRLEITSCANQSVVGILQSNDVSNEYIYMSVKNEITRLISAQTGGAQQHINKEDVNAFTIIYPGKVLMNEFTKRSLNSFLEIGVLLQESIYLSELRDALLPRLISGELQIPEEMMTS